MYNRLVPYRFVFPTDTTVGEALETAALLELALQDGPPLGLAPMFWCWESREQQMLAVITTQN